MINFIDDIAGNDKVKLILSNILESGNIPHAFLFTGTDGIGKENAAISFTKALNYCADPSDNSERISTQIDNLSEPFIKYILPLPRGKNETEQNDPYEKLTEDEIELINSEFKKKVRNPYYKIQIPKANFIKISSIRDIKKFLSFSYEDIKYRVILVSQAHLMNEEAQNALLKSLEEPPEGVIFILSTSAPEKLRETIRSRCWTVHFQPLDDNELLKILIDKFEIELAIAKTVVPFSSGSTQAAISLIENDFEDLLDKTVKILRYSFGKKFHSAFTEFDEILIESDTTRIKLIITMIIIWLTDFQKYRIQQSNNFFFTKQIETLQKFYIRFPDVNVAAVINNLDRISSSFRSNINLNIAVSNIIFQLSNLTLANKETSN
jgi:DNA polymerase III subunit delta'